MKIDKETLNSIVEELHIMKDTINYLLTTLDPSKTSTKQAETTSKTASKETKVFKGFVDETTGEVKTEDIWTSDITKKVDPSSCGASERQLKTIEAIELTLNVFFKGRTSEDVWKFINTFYLTSRERANNNNEL